MTISAQNVTSWVSRSAKCYCESTEDDDKKQTVSARDSSKTNIGNVSIFLSQIYAIAVVDTVKHDVCNVYEQQITSDSWTLSVPFALRLRMGGPMLR